MSSVSKILQQKKKQVETDAALHAEIDPDRPLPKKLLQNLKAKAHSLGISEDFVTR